MDHHNVRRISNRSYQRRDDRRGRTNYGAISFILACLGLSGAAVYAASQTRKAQLAPDTNCEIGKPLNGSTIILVDATEKLSPLELSRVRAGVDRTIGATAVESNGATGFELATSRLPHKRARPEYVRF